MLDYKNYLLNAGGSCLVTEVTHVPAHNRTRSISNSWEHPHNDTSNDWISRLREHPHNDTSNDWISRLREHPHNDTSSDWISKLRQHPHNHTSSDRISSSWEHPHNDTSGDWIIRLRQQPQNTSSDWISRSWQHLLNGTSMSHLQVEDVYHAEAVAQEFRMNGITLEMDEMDILSQSCQRSRQLRAEVIDDGFQRCLEKTREELINQQTSRGKKRQFCVFCKNNREREEVYTSHVLKDCQDKVICPILSKYTCPVCGASGDKAHTKKYCPHYDGLSVDLLLQTPRNCAGRHRKVAVGQITESTIHTITESVDRMQSLTLIQQHNFGQNAVSTISGTATKILDRIQRVPLIEKHKEC